MQDEEQVDLKADYFSRDHAELHAIKKHIAFRTARVLMLPVPTTMMLSKHMGISQQTDF